MNLLSRMTSTTYRLISPVTLITALLFIIAYPAITISQNRAARVERTYEDGLGQLRVKDIPNEFKSHDPKQIYEALESFTTSNQRNESESIADYKTRLGNLRPTLPDALTPYQMMFFVVTPDFSLIRYDAAKQQLIVCVDESPYNGTGKEAKRNYEAIHFRPLFSEWRPHSGNIDSKKVTNEEDWLSSYHLVYDKYELPELDKAAQPPEPKIREKIYFDIPIGADEAKHLLDSQRIRIAILFYPTAPYISTGLEGQQSAYYLHGQVYEYFVFDYLDDRLLRRFPVIPLDLAAKLPPKQ